jgi:nitronate monooxygenase
MATPWNQTRVSQLLGIQYPIIQGALGGLATQRLTAGVSNFGGLGSFGAHQLQPSAIADVIAEIRSLTTSPFAMNLWVSMEDEGARASDEAAFRRAASGLMPYLKELGAAEPAYTPYKPVRFEDQARVLLDAKVPAFSFVFGIPPAEILAEAKKQHIPTLGTATTVDEARALEQAGVDIVVASGFEGGGHRGSFLKSSEESLTGTFSLVPQTVDAVSIPVVAAGGVSDARGIKAAMALGAEGAQLGTVFLATAESGASALHREAILSGGARETTLTRGVTGRLARGIRNRLLTALNEPGQEFLPYPLQRALVRNVSAAAQTAGRADLVALWAGQSASLARMSDLQLLLASLVHGMGNSRTNWKAS